MSGVLDRMIKRTQGTLLTARPLVQSHCARSGAPIESASERVPQPTESALRTRAQISTRGDLDSDRREVKIPGDQPTKTSDPHSSELNEISGLSRSHRVLPPLDVQPNRNLNEPVLKRVDALPKTRQEEGDTFGKMLQSHLTLAPSLTLIESLENPIQRRMINSKTDTDANVLKANRIEQRSMTATNSRPSEENTEIHITIGSIELRAARSETPRPSPAFKARVTLDEFLGRSHGGGV